MQDRVYFSNGVMILNSIERRSLTKQVKAGEIFKDEIAESAAYIEEGPQMIENVVWIYKKLVRFHNKIKNKFEPMTGIQLLDQYYKNVMKYSNGKKMNFHILGTKFRAKKVTK